MKKGIVEMMTTTSDDREVVGVAQGVRAGDKAISIPVTGVAKRKQLEKSAMDLAARHRHQMTPFAALHEQPLIAESTCEKCEAYLQVNANPEARLAIGGTAIIYDCDEGQQ